MLDLVASALVFLAVGGAWMAALGWFTQWVHYPTFALIPQAEWSRYHEFHCNRISPIVGLGIALQTAGLGLLILSGPFAAGTIIAHSVLYALSVGWTAAVSIRAHHRLAAACDPAALAHLIRTSTVRSVAWTLQMSLALGQLILSST